jgi:UDP-N-acetylmuramoylalanine--D-glutamate ligase
MLKTDKKLKTNQLVQNRMKSLASFSAIEHRLEIVKTIKGVSWVNDSKSTDAGVTAFSFENLDLPIIWIVESSENKRNLDLLHDLALKKVVEIICYGNFETELKYYFAAKMKYSFKDNLLNAVSLAVENSKSGTTVLFSPACPSYSNFKNYQERGEYFKKLVNEMD